MTDFVTINNARLAYRLCGPDDAPLIITLHGGRGMGKVSYFLAFGKITHNAQVITGQTSRHIVLWVTNGEFSRLIIEATGRAPAPGLTHSTNSWTTLKASDSILLVTETRLSSAVVALADFSPSSMQSSLHPMYHT